MTQTPGLRVIQRPFGLRGILGVVAFILSFVSLGTPNALAAPGDTVSATATPQRTTAHPGDRFAVLVKVTIEDEWHIWPDQPQVKVPDGVDGLVPIASTLKVAGELPKGLRVHLDRVQWPKPVLLEVKAGLDKPVEVPLYKGTVRVYVPVSIAADAAPGDLKFTLTLRSQACNDMTCAPPGNTSLPVTVRVVPLDQPAASAPVGEFESFDATVLSRLDTPADAGATKASAAGDSGIRNFGAFGFNLNIDTKSWLGPVLVVLVAFLGGMVLNLTPCVLPVIPLKILSLQASAGSRSRLLLLGSMTAAGVVLFWVVLGLLIVGGVLFGVSQLASYWQFNLGLALFIGFMAVGMLGAWSAGLPDWVYSISPDNKSVPGAVGFGVLTAVLGTPCIAPFAGTALAWSAKQPAMLNMAMFVAIGLGMALPYFLLSINPKWLSFLPRAGPASALLKQMMGMLMLAVAVFFLGTGMLSLLAKYPWLGKVLHWWAVTGVVVVAAVWMTARTWQITRSPVRRTIFPGVALLLAAGAVWWAEGESAAARAEYGDRLWKAYDRAAIDREIAAGNVVVLDFTAEWCLTCKALEKAVLRRDAVVDALKSPGVVAFKADLTSDEAAGWAMVKTELKQPGIPLLVIWGPGLSSPWTSGAYTIDEVVETIARAKGTAKVAR